MDQRPAVGRHTDQKEPAPIRLALFGFPVRKSLSPFIHRSFAAQLGLEIEYECIETQQAGFTRALENFRQRGGNGCNVTLPLKQDAWQLAATATPEVQQAQAANTLVLQPPSGWSAHNTDGVGLVTDMVVNHGIELAGQRLLILGAGGAAAGILGGLLAAGSREIVLVNRSQERARALATRFAAHGQVSVVSWRELTDQRSFRIIINATSLGHQGKTPPLSESLFTDTGLCYDLNYHSASEPLKYLCEDMGQGYIDGLGMLVEQAARSFNIWTGTKPHSRAVIEACRAGPS